MTEDVIVPIAIFGSLVAIVWLLGVMAQRKRLVVHETIRLAMEKGQELTPQMIRDMALITNPRIADLRRGIVLIALALAFLLIGIINPSETKELFSIAVFPGLVGLAFIVLWKFGYDSAVD